MWTVNVNDLNSIKNFWLRFLCSEVLFHVAMGRDKVWMSAIERKLVVSGGGRDPEEIISGNDDTGGTFLSVRGMIQEIGARTNSSIVGSGHAELILLIGSHRVRVNAEVFGVDPNLSMTLTIERSSEIQRTAQVLLPLITERDLKVDVLASGELVFRRVANRHLARTIVILIVAIGAAATLVFALR